MVWKGMVVLAFLMTVAGLTIEVASHISDEATMVFFGVLCGAAAMIPISIILLLTVTRPGAPCPEEEPERPRRVEGEIVVTRVPVRRITSGEPYTED